MLFAVFDGHGGQEVAIFCEKYMPEMLVNHEAYLKGDYKKALEDTFVEIDFRLISDEGAKLLKQITIDLKKEKTGDGTLDKQELEELKQTPFGAGCTSCVCLVTPDTIYCANAGDSRAILATKEGKVIELSHDHKPENDDESKRVYDNGGFVQDGRVNGVIAVSRAIGDWEYKTVPTKKVYNKFEEAKKFQVTCIPDIKKVEIKPDLHDFMIVACDGIWDCFSNRKAMRFVQKSRERGPRESKSSRHLSPSKLNSKKLMENGGKNKYGSPTIRGS